MRNLVNNEGVDNKSKARENLSISLTGFGRALEVPWELAGAHEFIKAKVC